MLNDAFAMDGPGFEWVRAQNGQAIGWDENPYYVDALAHMECGLAKIPAAPACDYSLGQLMLTGDNPHARTAAAVGFPWPRPECPQCDTPRRPYAGPGAGTWVACCDCD